MAGELVLEQRFVAEVRQRRGSGGVRHADVDDAADSCFTGATPELQRVRDGVLERKAAVLEADPVGVVEDVRADEVAPETLRIAERERHGLDGRARRSRCAAERADPAPGGEELVGDRPPGVRERAGDGVERGVSQARTGASRRGPRRRGRLAAAPRRPLPHGRSPRPRLQAARRDPLPGTSR